MTFTARRTPYRDTMPGEYVCGRCGITKRCHHSRPKPTLYADCRDVLALERTI